MIKIACRWDDLSWENTEVNTLSTGLGKTINKNKKAAVIQGGAFTVFIGSR